MPRIAREKSITGIYHVMLRGIDKRNIFLSDGDYRKFLEYIKKAGEKCEFKLYAYCLMTNHVHLLLKSESDEIGDIIRRISVGYAQYHNIQYGRTGHLFQNRFRSEAIETEAYFITVLRYIHQNPIKAGIVRGMRDYKWSSYIYYLSDSKSLIDTTFALEIFGSIANFEEYMNEENNDQCLDHNQKQRYTDEDLKKIISSLIDMNLLYNLDAKSRNETIIYIKEKTQASNRQLSRVLNIGRGIIERVK